MVPGMHCRSAAATRVELTEHILKCPVLKVVVLSMVAGLFASDLLRSRKAYIRHP